MNYVRKLLWGLKVRTLLYPQKGFGTFLFECLLQPIQIVEKHYKFFRELFHLITTCGRN